MRIHALCGSMKSWKEQVRAKAQKDGAWDSLYDDKMSDLWHGAHTEADSGARSSSGGFISFHFFSVGFSIFMISFVSRDEG